MLHQFDYMDIIWCRAAKTKLNSFDILCKKVAKIALDVGVNGEPSLMCIGICNGFRLLTQTETTPLVDIYV